MERTTIVHCMREPYDIYIGRGLAPHPGKEHPQLGNPFVIGKHGDRKEVLDLYRRYAVHRFKTEPEFRTKVRLLKGRKLGCWCANTGSLTKDDPTICHGQILAALAET